MGDTGDAYPHSVLEHSRTDPGGPDYTVASDLAVLIRIHQPTARRGLFVWEESAERVAVGKYVAAKLARCARGDPAHLRCLEAVYAGWANGFCPQLYTTTHANRWAWAAASFRENGNVWKWRSHYWALYFAGFEVERPYDTALDAWCHLQNVLDNMQPADRWAFAAGLYHPD